jgi:hypothetical protein
MPAESRNEIASGLAKGLGETEACLMASLAILARRFTVSGRLVMGEDLDDTIVGLTVAFATAFVAFATERKSRAIVA